MTEDGGILPTHCGPEVSAVCSVSACARCGSAAGRAGSLVQMCPRRAETGRSTVDEQCLSCQLWFPAWPPLLIHPSQPPPLALCMWTLLPVDSPLSGLSHATVSNHPAHPPLNPESRSPSPTSSPRWGCGEGAGGEASKTLLLHNRSSFVPI